MASADLTTNQRLRLLGLTTEDAGMGRKHVSDIFGELVFTGTAHEVSAWLDEVERADAAQEVML